MFCNRDLLKLCFLYYRWSHREKLCNILLNNILLNRVLHIDRTIKHKFSLCGHKCQVTSLLCLNDNNIASGSYDKTIRLWDYKDNYKCLKVLEGHKGGIYSLVQLLNGDIASGSLDDSIKIWDYRHDYTCLHTIQVDDVPIRLQILPEGHLVSAASSIRVWDAGNCYKLMKEIEDEYLLNILVSKNGDIIFSSEKVLRVYNSKDFQCTNVLEGHKSGIVFIIELSDRNIATGSLDCCIKIWTNENNTYSCIRTFYEFFHLLSMTPLSDCNVLVGNSKYRLLNCNVGQLKLIRMNKNAGYAVVQLSNEDIIFGDCYDICLWGL
jgi:WD40 repeat protein